MLPLPRMTMSGPGCCFNLLTSVTRSPCIRTVFCHATVSSVRENTVLRIAFMPAATLGSIFAACGVGQNAAIMSYVTRPNSSSPLPLALALANAFHSSSCLCAQLMSPFASVKKPSSEMLVKTFTFRMLTSGRLHEAGDVSGQKCSVEHRTDLDDAVQRRGRARGPGKRGVDVGHVDQVEPTELFLGIGIRTVQDLRFRVTDPHGCGSGRRLQSGAVLEDAGLDHRLHVGLVGPQPLLLLLP